MKTTKNGKKEDDGKRWGTEKHGFTTNSKKKTHTHTQMKKLSRQSKTPIRTQRRTTEKNSKIEANEGTENQWHRSRKNKIWLQEELIWNQDIAN
jgi:hypothetical protein